MAKCPVCGTTGAEAGVLCPKGCAYLVRESALEVDAKGLERYLGKLIGGRYAVTGYLGRGGMGVVYRARDIKGTGDVAVKVLLNQKPGQRAIRRFLREAKVAVRLRHPNIVSTYGFGRVDEGFFLAMELVEGQPLSRYWKRGVPFDALMAISLQSLSALGAAHAAEVIHRDLKPGNVLVGNNDRGGLQVKVLDFGLARFLQPERDTLTRTGELVGTPRYMSPEQAKGSRDIDITTDLYALGVILYEFVTGKVLFDAEVPTAVAVKHITDPVPNIIVRDGLDLPQGFEAIIRKLLAKDPKARYPTASATRAALAPFLKKASGAELEPEPEPDQIDVPSSSPIHSDVASAMADGLVRFEPPIVGRSAQLRKLWTLHRQVIDHGRGALVLVSGETGVGKTRLLESFRDGILEAAEMEWCSGETGQKGGHGLAALRGALGELFGVRGQDRELTRKLIHDVLACWGQPDAEEVDRLTALFMPEGLGGLAQGRFIDEDNDERAQAEREQLFGAIERVLRRAAAERPLVVCLEDLHWAGSPTWELLEFLAARLKGAPEPLLIVGTLRSDAPEAKLWSDAVVRLQRYEGDLFHRIDLQVLEEDQSQTLIRVMLKATDRLTQTVLGMTSGNPLHLIQVLRFLHDSEMIQQKDGVWDLPESQRAREVVPPAMADLMSARMEQLLARHKQREDLGKILQRCAMVGRRVPYRLLHRLLELEAEQTPGVRPLIDLLEEALDFFVQEGVFVEDLENTEDVLTFAHGMLRESLHQALKGKRTTRATHLAAAQAKEQYWSRTPDAYASEIAMHYEEAKRWPEAMEWHVKAAQGARRSWDLRACEEHYLQAEVLMAQVPDVKPVQKLTILQPLGELFSSTGQHDRAEEYFRQAFNTAEDSGQSGAMAHLLFLQGNVARERAKLREAERCYRECLVVSRALNVREGIGNALLGLSKLARESGAAPEAHRFLTAAEEQFETLQDTRALADTQRQRAFIFMKEGNWSEAKQHLKNALALNQQRDDKWGLAHAHRDLAELAVLRGRNDEGQINARKALDLFENIGARFGFAKSVATLAEVHKAQGHQQAAGEQFHRALAIYESLGAHKEMAGVMFQLGVVALKLGRPREAKTWFEQARAQAMQVEDAFGEGMALAGLAWTGSIGDDPQSTRTWLQHAHRKLPRDTNYVPDLADIYQSCARCFENHQEKALAEACRRKALLITQSLGRA